MRWFMILAMLVVAGCANMEIAKINVQDEGITVLPALKPVPYSIDTEYLESKFVNYFAVSYNEEALRKTRFDFVETIKMKIKNSMPSSAPYITDLNKPNTFERYIVFLPVIKIMPYEMEAMVNVRCDFTARIYNNSGMRVKSVTVSDIVSIPYYGRFDYIGTIEYYRTFNWNKSLLDKIEEALNKSLEQSLIKIMNSIGNI